MPKNISRKTLAEIKAKHLAPAPQWYFLLKNGCIWTAAGLAAVVGAATLAVIFHVVLNRDWFLLRQRPPIEGRLLLDLPYLWLILLGLTVFLAYYNVCHSKTGYRYSAYLIIVASLLTSLVLGAGFYLAGFGEDLDTGLGRQLPSYRSLEKSRQNIWSNPEVGLLAGKVLSKTDESLELRDLCCGQVWKVDISGAQIVGLKAVKVGDDIAIMGQKITDDTFRAESIRQWFKALFHPPKQSRLFPGPPPIL